MLKNREIDARISTDPERDPQSWVGKSPITLAGTPKDKIELMSIAFYSITSEVLDPELLRHWPLSSIS